MNWRRCRLVIGVAVALAMVIILTVALLLQPALAASQTWYITDTPSGANYVMLRGSSGGGNTDITVGASASVIWVADESPSYDVSFEAGSWTGQIAATPDSSTHDATVEIGSWNGASFSPAGTSTTMTFPTKGAVSTQPFTISASAFTVPQNNWLTLRFNNLVSNKTIAVATDGTSIVSSPATDPGYPDPPWESYRADGPVWGTVANPYDGTYQTVYMHGGGFEASQQYHVGFYDASASDNKVASTDPSSTAGGALSTPYLLATDENATAGTWHAVAYKDPDSPPDTYNPADPKIVADDDFEVTPVAIPEFPAVIAGIVVAGMCFGIYYWMRKRKLAYVKA